MEAILAKVWDGAGDTWQWLRGVILGEWEDDRSISQVVTDAMAGFVPGVGSIITLRDLLAVIVRLARHPDKRDDVNEWILLVAMLLPLLITLLGAAAAGVGVLVGAELGGFLRAVALFIVKQGGVALKAMVEFFQAHGYGDVVKALKQVKFAQYKNTLIKGLDEQLTHTIHTGTAAPEVAKLKPEPGQPVIRNPEPPEPGNTRRWPSGESWCWRASASTASWTRSGGRWVPSPMCLGRRRWNTRRCQKPRGRSSGRE